jgi:hypothetical protein
MAKRTALLVLQMRKWAKSHNVKNTELAEMLGAEIFKGRNQPTGEQVLVMFELMKTRR